MSSPEEYLKSIRRFKSLLGFEVELVVKSYLVLWLEERGGDENAIA